MPQLKIKVRPSSSKNKIVKMADGTFKIWIKSPPRKGKANIELEKYIRDVTGIRVKIVNGFFSENKTIEFDLEKDKFIKILEKLMRNNS
ncbi:MAG: DUF167 domain-containing protein [candidate division WOR-3 bacterium]